MARIDSGGGALDALLPPMSFQTVMDPEMVESSCSYDHKALSRALNCSCVERELSPPSPPWGPGNENGKGGAGEYVWLDKTAGWMARCGQILA